MCKIGRINTYNRGCIPFIKKPLNYGWKVNGNTLSTAWSSQTENFRKKITAFLEK